MTGAGPLGRWWRRRQRHEQTHPDVQSEAVVPGEPPEPAPVAVTRRDEVPAQWSPGLVVAGLYEIGERCGAGRTGVVHRVRHLGWNQDLAVKSPQLPAGPDGLRAFLDEATVWLDLPPHPQLCACHFVQVLDGAPRIFVEYAAGGSVAEALLASRCTTVVEILDVAIQLAWGLQATHDAGLVHQDVRLTKVVRTADGAVKLLPGSAPAHQAGAEGRAGDVWSWAVSVLEMFVGRVTWQAGPAASEALAAYAQQPSPGRPTMPGPVAALLRDCLTPHPADRPGSLRLVADRLIDAFQAELGRPYPRNAAEAAEHGADGLNNKALSLLDLGRPDEAERCWEQALQTDPRHPDTTYNWGLLRWRTGRIIDRTLIDQLEAVRAVHPEAGVAAERVRYLLGLVHRERGDATADTRTSCTLTLTGHTQKVWSVAITADGRHALSGSFDGTVRWWDLATGRCLRTLSGHNQAVTSVALTPDGRHALTCSADGMARRWELASGRFLGTLDGRFVSAAITPDARYALTGGTDGTVRLWDLHADRWLCTLAGHTDYVSSVALTPDARYGVSCDPPDAHLWDLATGRCLATVTGDVKSVALPPDDRRVLTGHDDGEVTLWDLSSGPSGRRLQNLTGHIGSVHSVAITADSRYALSGGLDGTVRWWDLTSGRCVRTLTDHSDAVVSVAVTPDGRHAVSGGYDKTVRLWDVSSGSEAPWSYSRLHSAADLTAQAAEFRIRLDQARRSLGHDDVTGAAAELRQAQTVPGLARHPALLELWRRAGRSGRSGRRTDFQDAREHGVLTGHTKAVSSVMITPDGHHALSGSSDQSMRWWDLDTGQCLRTLSGHTDTIFSVAVTDDGRHALSGSNDKSVRWWDLDTGRCLRTLSGHIEGVALVAVTQDGRHVLSGSNDKSLRWWDLDTGQCLRTLSGHTEGVWSVAVTPDGRHAVSGSFDHTMRWWDLSSGRCLATFSGHTDTVLSVAITPDGRHALSGGDGTVRLWDLSTGRCLRTLSGHTDTILSVAITSDARHALSGSVDATVRLWDLDTGQCLRTLSGHTERIWSVAMTPTASRALSGSQDTTMRLWDLDWDYEFPQEFP